MDANPGSDAGPGPSESLGEPGADVPDPLGAHDVHVWLARLPDDPGELGTARRLLDGEESARADRLRRPADRVRFVATRAHVRRLLGAYAGMSPETVRIGAGVHGKPETAIAGGGDPLHFSVSHSGAVAAIALGRREVGVDVERVPASVEWDPIAREFFSPAELASLDRLRRGERPRACVECWVRKEAYLKALGVGLRRPTTTFTVPILDATGRVDDRDAGRSDAPTRVWTVSGVDVPADYAAAVCTDGDATVTTRWIPQTP